MEQKLDLMMLARAMDDENIDLYNENIELVKDLFKRNCKFKLRTIEDYRHFITNNVHEIDDQLRVSKR